MEDWKNIQVGNNLYSVSSEGVVKKNNVEIKSYRYSSGYRAVYLDSGEGYGVEKSVHNLVAVLFLGSKPSSIHEVNHKNGIKNDNRLENLEWVTHSRNSQHSYDIGLSKSGYPLLNGERHPSSKLNWEKVREIRRLRVEKGLTSITLGKMFGVSYRTILKVCSGEMWNEDLEERRKDLDYVPSEFSHERIVT